MIQEKELLEAWQISGLTDQMPKSSVAEMLQRANHRIRNIKKGTLYALAGDRVTSLQIVISGELNAEMVGNSGKQILIDTLDKGRILAPALIYTPENVLPVTLTADKDTVIYSVSSDEFRQMMHLNPILMGNFFKIVGNTTSFLTSKIRQLSLKSLQGRIGEYLLNLHKETLKGNNTVTIDCSWKELAGRFGVNRQSLARSLAQMQEGGLITVWGKNIKLHEFQKLRNLP